MALGAQHQAGAAVAGLFALRRRRAAGAAAAAEKAKAAGSPASSPSVASETSSGSQSAGDPLSTRCAAPSAPKARHATGAANIARPPISVHACGVAPSLAVKAPCRWTRPDADVWCTVFAAGGPGGGTCWALAWWSPSWMPVPAGRRAKAALLTPCRPSAGLMSAAPAPAPLTPLHACMTHCIRSARVGFLSHALLPHIADWPGCLQTLRCPSPDVCRRFQASGAAPCRLFANDSEQRSHNGALVRAGSLPQAGGPQGSLGPSPLHFATDRGTYGNSGADGGAGSPAAALQPCGTAGAAPAPFVAGEIDPLEVEFCRNSNGQRIVLGEGAFGRVRPAVLLCVQISMSTRSITPAAARPACWAT